MNVKKLKPKLSKNESQKLIIGEGVSLNRWKNFAIRCQANLHVVRSVLTFHENKCALCNKSSKGKLQIHHIDYAHACIYDDVEPDCGFCQNKTPEAFQACVSRLAPVHGFCHLEIHKNELNEEALKALKSKSGLKSQKPRKSQRSVSRHLMKKDIQAIYNKIYNDELGKEGFVAYLLKHGFELKAQTSHSFTVYNVKAHRAQFKWAELAANKYK